MKKWCAGLALVLAALQANAQWDTVATGTVTQFTGITFSNTNTGLICGYDSVSHEGSIIMTSNAGSSWSQLVGPDSTAFRLNGITYVNPNLWVCVGDSGHVLESNYSVKIGTAHLRNVRFINDTTGFICGNNGVLYKSHTISSIPGALGWDTLNSGTVNNLYDVQFINTTTGWATGDGWIARTTDGGMSWTQDTTSPFLGFFNGRSIYFIDALRGFCVGQFGWVLQTVDGGTTWTELTAISTTSDLNAIRFTNSLSGVIVGNGGKIFRTSDGGFNWMDESLSYLARPYSAIAYSNDSTAYACASRGKLVRTNQDISSVEAQQPATLALSAFPNPLSSGDLSIAFDAQTSGRVELQLVDMQGRLLYTHAEELQQGEQHLAISENELPVSPGIYFLRIVARKQAGNLRIVRL